MPRRNGYRRRLRASLTKAKPVPKTEAGRAWQAYKDRPEYHGKWGGYRRKTVGEKLHDDMLAWVTVGGGLYLLSKIGAWLIG